MLYRGALYSNLHTYDFGDNAAPSVDNSPGHWRRSLRHPFVRGKGGGCPSFEQKDDAKIAASAGGYIRIARQWRFLVYFFFLYEFCPDDISKTESTIILIFLQYLCQD